VFACFPTATYNVLLHWSSYRERGLAPGVRIDLTPRSLRRRSGVGIYSGGDCRDERFLARTFLGPPTSALARST